MQQITILLILLCASSLNSMEYNENILDEKRYLREEFLILDAIYTKKEALNSSKKKNSNNDETVDEFFDSFSQHFHEQIAQRNRKKSAQKERKHLFNLERQKTEGERIRILEILELLPAEVQGKIVTIAFQSSKNIDEAVAVVEAARMAGLNYDNLNDFTCFAHILANKFRVSTKSVAKKFGTPTTYAYLNINNKLLSCVKSRSSLQAIPKLIDNGADLNFTNAKDPSKFDMTGKEIRSPLHLAVSTNNIEAVKLLLNLGANPDWADQRINKEKLIILKHREYNTSSSRPNYEQLVQGIEIAKQIKKILEDAMSKK